jgi:hypothetical protein
MVKKIQQKKKTREDAAKKKSEAFKTRKEIRVEKFLLDEIDRYIKLHKEHEKEIKYIG